MSKIEELQEKRNEAARAVEQMGSEYHSRREAGKKGDELWPDETRQKWDEANDRLNALDSELQDERQHAEVSGRLQSLTEQTRQQDRDTPGLDDIEPGTTRSYGERFGSRERAERYHQRQKQKRLALSAWFLRGELDEQVSDEHREACHALGFDPSQRKLVGRLLDTRTQKALQSEYRNLPQSHRSNEPSEYRALSAETAATGAELIPTTTIAAIELAMLSFSGVAQAADTMTTSTGETMKWPTGDDTANEGVLVGTEGEDVTTIGTPDPSFSNISWGAYESHSKFIKVPWALFTDSLVSIDVMVAGMIGERLGRMMETYLTTGTGTDQPTGVVTASNAGATAAATTALAYDDIIALDHALDPAYRNGAEYMFHDDILKALRLLKDSDGRPLWQDNMRVGAPSTLNGRPYYINQKMASTIEASAKTMLIGQFSQYKIRRVGAIQIVRAQERFVENLQTGFLGYMRFDGNLLKANATTGNPVQHIAQAAA